MPLRLIQGELFPIKKACITCNVEKPLDEFYADRGTSGGKKMNALHVQIIELVRFIERLGAKPLLHGKSSMNYRGRS